MSGSLSYFVYKSDNGGSYALFGDKSNILAANPSGASNAGLPAIKLPRNIVPRYALFADATGLIRRKVALLTPADVAALTGSLSFTPQGESVAVTITAIRGEKVNLPKLADTGRTT